MIQSQFLLLCLNDSAIQQASKTVIADCWRVLKAPPLKSSDLHFLLIKCHCLIYDDNIGLKLKISQALLFLGRLISLTISLTSIARTSKNVL